MRDFYEKFKDVIEERDTFTMVVLMAVIGYGLGQLLHVIF